MLTKCCAITPLSFTRQFMYSSLPLFLNGCTLLQLLKKNPCLLHLIPNAGILKLWDHIHYPIATDADKMWCNHLCWLWFTRQFNIQWFAIAFWTPSTHTIDKIHAACYRFETWYLDFEYRQTLQHTLGLTADCLQN